MFETPSAFKRLISLYLYEFAQDYATLDEFVAMTTRLATAGRDDENDSLRSFLTRLIEAEYTDRELEDIWVRRGEEYPFDGREIRQLLPLIRDNLGLWPPGFGPNK